MTRSEQELDLLAPPLLVTFGLYVAAAFGDIFFYERFWTAHAYHPDPPWYLIGRDFVSAILFALGLVASLVTAVLTRHRYREASRLAAFMAILWMGYKVAEGALILARTSRIWDASTATTAWHTGDDYLRDPLRWILFALALGAAVLFERRSRRSLWWRGSL